MNCCPTSICHSASLFCPIRFWASFDLSFWYSSLRKTTLHLWHRYPQTGCWPGQGQPQVSELSWKKGFASKCNKSFQLTCTHILFSYLHKEWKLDNHPFYNICWKAALPFSVVPVEWVGVTVDNTDFWKETCPFICFIDAVVPKVKYVLCILITLLDHDCEAVNQPDTVVLPIQIMKSNIYWLLGSFACSPDI